jgi:hypothetical protein
MNIVEFDKTYVIKKGYEKIDITCDNRHHPDNLPRVRTIGKTAARRNILKNGGDTFICRACCMIYDNPMNKSGEARQTNKIVVVHCHQCGKVRNMKKSCYYGKIEAPYKQVCGSCAQKGKVIPEAQKQKIRDTLSGRKLSPEHKTKILAYRQNNQSCVKKRSIGKAL